MFKVTPVPIIEDNYVWIVEHAKHCIIVDPGDAQPVLNHLDQHSLTPSAILITHKHWDHVTGIRDIKARFPEITVYGPEYEEIPYCDVSLTDGAEFSLAQLTWRVKHLPGHTLGLIAYIVEDSDGLHHVFSGDCLFSSGCGYMFEGSPEQFQSSLAYLMSLPERTKIYPTHEYTLANIDFALHVEPNNIQLIAKHEQSQTLRSRNQPTVPTTVAAEKATNPFVRWDQPDIIRSVNLHTKQVLAMPADIFAALREWKNGFKG